MAKNPLIKEIDAQTQRLNRSADRLIPDLRDLQHEQDGSEIQSRELELITDRVQNLSAHRDAFERMRDAAAEDYLNATGQTWRPRSGSHTSQTGKLTSAAIDARDFVRARKDRKTQAHLPEGTLVAVTGGKDVTDPATVFNRLDKVRAKYTDILFLYLRPLLSGQIIEQIQLVMQHVVCGSEPGIEKPLFKGIFSNKVTEKTCNNV